MKYHRYAIILGAVVVGLVLARGYSEYGSRFHLANTAKHNPSVPPGLNRNLRDITLTKELTEEQVAARWGPFDAKEGFGVDYVVIYALGHDQEVWFHFLADAPHQLNFAVLLRANAERETLWSR